MDDDDDDDYFDSVGYASVK